MTCGILIFLLIHYEWTYDTFHTKAEQIYRVYSVVKQPDGTLIKAVSSSLEPIFADHFPEITQTISVKQSTITIKNRDGLSLHSGNAVLFAPPEFLEVFSFPFQQGNHTTALQNRYSIVLTAETAEKLFGNESPLGKTLPLAIDYPGFEDFTVTGVLNEIPGNSSIQFDVLLPAEWASEFFIFGSSAFVQLADGRQAASLEGKFLRFVEKHLGRDPDTYRLKLQPISQIHQDQSILGGLKPSAQYGRFLPRRINPATPNTLASLGIMVLVMACINFATLAIGRATTRAKEIGVRKVAGAMRKQLIWQFLGESVFLSLTALVLGMVLAELLLPMFSGLVQKRLVFDYTTNGTILVGLITLALLTGLFAGCYPAIILSGFHPVAVLRGIMRIKATNPFGRVLIVLQFSVSLFFLISALVMMRQLHLLKTKDLGFDAEEVILLSRFSVDVEAYRNELSAQPLIRSVSLSFPAPGHWGSAYNDSLGVSKFSVDYDFLQTLGIKLVEGRDFSRDFPSDETQAVLINQTLAKKWGWDNPIGQQLTGFHMGKVHNPRIIGVVEDFHQFILYHKISPTVLFLNAMEPDYIFARVNPESIPVALDLMRAAWQKVSPDFPFEFRPIFLSDHFAQFYPEEERWGWLIVYTSIVAMFISCLGVLGLSSLSVSQRTKEIGIRKALGASVSSIVTLLSRELVGLIGIANILTWPIAYLAMRHWLADFAYRIELEFGIFILGGILVFVIAWLTVSYQSIKAAFANPVDALRYE